MAGGRNLSENEDEMFMIAEKIPLLMPRCEKGRAGFWNILATRLLLLLVITLLLDVIPIRAETGITRENLGELRIAVVPEKHIFEQRRRYRFLADYLEKMLSIRVDIQIMPDHAVICDAILRKEVNAGFFDSLSYVLAKNKVAIEPLIRPVWMSGSAHSSGHIVTRKDSGIFSVKDMKKRSLALVDRGSVLGFLFPLWYFHGMKLHDVEKYFARVVFAKSYEAAAWAVYIGEVDVGVTKSDVFEDFVREYPDFGEQMTIIATSKELPVTALAVATQMDPYLKEQLSLIFVHMDKTTAGRQVLNQFDALAFTRAHEEDYRPVLQMLEETGIDLGGQSCAIGNLSTKLPTSP